jgi:hypothetical protein
MDFERLQALLAAFEREGLEFAIFGAIALNLHGLARFTEHLDLFVAPEAENIERLKRALMLVFEDPAIDEITPPRSARALSGGPVCAGRSFLPHRHPDEAGNGFLFRQSRNRTPFPSASCSSRWSPHACCIERSGTRSGCAIVRTRSS